MPNGPRATEALIEKADSLYRMALELGNSRLIVESAAVLSGLINYDADIQHAVTTLRRGRNSTSAIRQQEELLERQRWGRAQVPVGKGAGDVTSRMR